jgi:cobalt-zinc-cadmium efflux system protein
VTCPGTLDAVVEARAPLDGQSDLRRLVFALALTLAFMACEVAAGFAAHSLALVSDAAHMLTDAAALALALVAARLARRPPSVRLTYGFKRVEILSALANGIALLLLAALFVYEAVRRLVTPSSPGGWTMLAVAIAGVAVNLLATWQLARADRRSLNLRGAFKHVLTDLYAFVGTAVAAVLILTTGFVRADPIATLLVAALMVQASRGLLTGAGRVLLEATPEGMDTAEIGAAMAAVRDVVDVHDLHVWEITSGFPALSAHVMVSPGEDCHAVRREIESMLAERFEIDHTTLQVDHDETRVVFGTARSQRPKS